MRSQNYSEEIIDCRSRSDNGNLPPSEVTRAPRYLRDLSSAMNRRFVNALLFTVRLLAPAS
jgi:hypothetical protein